MPMRDSAALRAQAAIHRVWDSLTTTAIMLTLVAAKIATGVFQLPVEPRGN